MFELVIILHSDGVDPAAYAGHMVAVSIDRELHVGAGADGVAETIQAQVSGLVDANARATVVLPDKNKLKGDVLVSVSAPDGRRLKEKRVAARALPSTMRFIVPPAQPITPPADAPAPSRAPSRIYGEVVDKHGTAKVAGLQVVLWGKATGADKFEPLMIATTDAKGKFTGDYPEGSFSEAYGGAGGAEIVSIKLLDDRTFPHRVILVIDGNSLPAQENDCNCDVQPPRMPDTAALSDSSAAYTNDLGGLCVVLNKPNRTLEEFDFYVAVRTTEPAIQGLTVTDIDGNEDEILSEAVKDILDKLTKFRSTSTDELAELAIQSAEHLFSSGQPQLTATKTASSSKQATGTKVSGAKVPGTKTSGGKSSSTRASEPKPSTALRLPSGNGTRPLRLSSTQINALINSRYGLSQEAVSKAMTQSDVQQLKDLLLTLKRRKPGRNALNASNPLDWDDEPTFYQAATISHGHLLHLKQEWIADGYSLGDLLYSLPLAPGQKRQIAVLDWERKDEGQRSENLQASDKITASLSRDRDVSEIVRGTITEHLEGESRAKTAGVGMGGGIGAAVPVDGALLGISGGAATGSGTSISEATLDGNRNVTTSSLQRLSDKTSQSASSVRSQRSTVIQTVKQGETVRAQTEVVANYNHCHAMTVEYFEVLRHFLIKQSLVDVQECLFVPLMMSQFDAAKALRWKAPLTRHLKDGRLVPAFEALDRIERGYSSSSHGERSFADEQIKHFSGSMQLSFFITRPADKEEEKFDAEAWRGVENLLGRSGAGLWGAYIKDRQSKDESFIENLSEDIVRELIKSFRFIAITARGTEKELPLFAELSCKYEHAKPLHLQICQRKKARTVLRNNIVAIRLESNLMDNPQWHSLSRAVAPGARIECHSLRLRYSTDNFVENLCSMELEHANFSIATGLRVDAPLSRREQRRLLASDKELAQTLIPHLNDNLEHYHRAIWSEMDPARRFMLLDGVIAPNSGGKSVASVVENRLLGIVGNCMVLPVVKSLRLDPTYKDEENFSLFDSYSSEAVLNRIAVPTRGVYAEAVMGGCNSCEKKDETRFWRFEESPLPDQPTQIQPLNTESRLAPAPDLTAKEFAAPIINLQNAPQAPDPLGLAGLLSLLGSSSTFKDLTGLAGNQANSAAALQSQLGAAQTFSSNAAKLAAQVQLERSADKAFDLIKKAQEKGLISDEKAAKLTERLLGGFSGGGASDQPGRINPEAVKELAANIGSKPGGKFSFQDDANQQSFELTGPSAGSTATPGTTVSGVTLGTPLPSGTPSTKVSGSKDAPSFEIDGESTDLYRFFNESNDKSGSILLTVKVLPPHKESDFMPFFGFSKSKKLASAEGLVLPKVRPGGYKLIILAKDPGVLDFECYLAKIGTSKPLSFITRELLVPRYVEISENGTEFETFLSSFNLPVSLKATFKEIFFTEMLNVAEHCLSTKTKSGRKRHINVRLVGNSLYGIADSLPPHFTSADRSSFVTSVRIGNKSAGGTIAENLDESAAGPKVHDQRIVIYPGDFANPAAVTANLLDPESRAAADAIFNKPTLTTDEVRNAALILGRLTGEIVAHEIVHSVLGLFSADGASLLTASLFELPLTRYTLMDYDISNPGNLRTFVRRTGTTLTDPARFPATGSFAPPDMELINCAQTTTGTLHGSISFLDNSFYAD